MSGAVRAVVHQATHHDEDFWRIQLHRFSDNAMLGLPQTNFKHAALAANCGSMR
jgi:hypothetical protein